MNFLDRLSEAVGSVRMCVMQQVQEDTAEDLDSQVFEIYSQMDLLNSNNPNYAVERENLECELESLKRRKERFSLYQQGSDELLEEEIQLIQSEFGEKITLYHLDTMLE